MAKIRTTINLDENVVRRAKELGINISTHAEIGILQHIREIERTSQSIGRKPSNSTTDDSGNNDNNSTQPNGISSYLTDLPGFEPELEAPEASVISKLHYRPYQQICYQNLC